MTRARRPFACAFLRVLGIAGVAALPPLAARAGDVELHGRTVLASSTHPESDAAGAVDGDRFSTEDRRAWKGGPGLGGWWWQIASDREFEVGAILQVVGDHPFVFRNAPTRYVWRGSADGRDWFDLANTAVENDGRLFRLHRLPAPRRMRFLRMVIQSVSGAFPTLREVELYGAPSAKPAFPDWAVVVNTTHDERLPGAGKEFIPLAKAHAEDKEFQAQQVWLAGFREAFVAVEPHPLCAFLSGNTKDWCEVKREPWRGVQEVLKAGRLPLWGACGGAQGLAILAETGVDKPWDCPHCRDPKNLKSPIYSHIGHKGPLRRCGDYGGCIWEKGSYRVKQMAKDPVFDGLPREFLAPESHCGQIERPPAGWIHIGGAGEGTLTAMQCLRVKDRYIYAAQFHIEMAGQPATSGTIMANFLRLAKSWGGYNPDGKPAPSPVPWPEER
jgi:hypothetical protein